MTQTDPTESFETQAGQERQGLGSEFLDFLKHNKKWWLLPIIIVMLVFAVLVFLSTTPISPFIYPLF